MANTISEMWEHTYRNVEGEAFPYKEEEMWDSVIAEDSIRFLDGQKGEEPFFLYVGFRAPHPPWCAPERFHELYDPDDIGELIETKQRLITSALKISVVSSAFLIAIGRTDRTVHVKDNLLE